MWKKEFILFIFVFLQSSCPVKLDNESQSDSDETADDTFHSEPKLNIFTAESKNKFQADSENHLGVQLEITSFPEVLTVKKIKEEQVKVVEIIRLTEPAGCYYKIDSQYPTAGNYFRLIDEPNHSKSVVAERIDREDSVFKDMTVARCIVNLSLSCKNTSDSREKEIWETAANGMLDTPAEEIWEPPCSYDSTNKSNIETDPSRMIIVVIIEDINDNAPVFLEQPFLAYPSNYEFLRKYPLNEVAVIKATDADIGQNAEIRYKISGNLENQTFAIHPVTGQLYQLRTMNNPKGDKISDKSIKLTIEATDGMQTSVNDITINLLDDAQMVEALYVRGLLESVDEKFRNVSTDFDVSILTAHQLPTNLTKFASNLSDADNFVLTRAFLYAVERNNSKIVQSEVLAKFLRQQNWIVEVNLVTEMMNGDNRTNNNNDDPNNDDNGDENDDGGNESHADTSGYGWFTWFMISLFVICLVLIACKIVFTIWIQRQNDISMKMWNERHGVSSLNLEDDPTANDNPWISPPNLDIDFSYAKPATPIPQTRETIGISRDRVSYKPDGQQTDCNFPNKIF